MKEMHLFWIKLSCNSNIELEAGKTFLPEIAFLQEAIISLDFAVFRLNISLVKSKAFYLDYLIYPQDFMEPSFGEGAIFSTWC